MRDKVKCHLGMCQDSVSRSGKLPFSSEDGRILTALPSGNSFLLGRSEIGLASSTPFPDVDLLAHSAKGRQNGMMPQTDSFPAVSSGSQGTGTHPD